MSTEPQLFRVDPATKESLKVAEVDFSHLGLQERQDIQEWIVANPEILGDDLLIIAKEFSDFDRTSERLDPLAIDRDGKLVVIELKRDHSGVDAHWQAIKYASYLRRATHQDILRMLANFERVSEAEAEEKLLEHVETSSLENLNDDQRVILASHRFAPEVTSAVLWLNEKAQDENLITCVQLIPYQDGDVLYVQTNTIIPVVGTERYSIQIDATGTDESSGAGPSSAGIKAARRRARNREDEVTHFARKVETRALNELPDDLKTDCRSGHAMGNSSERYYCMWYRDRFPWANTKFNYVLHVTRRNDGSFRVRVNFETRKNHLRQTLGYSDDDINQLKIFLESILECEIQDNHTFLRPREIVGDSVTSFDEKLVEATASALKKMIENVTDSVEQFIESRGQDAEN